MRSTVLAQATTISVLVAIGGLLTWAHGVRNTSRVFPWNRTQDPGPLVAAFQAQGRRELRWGPRMVILGGICACIFGTVLVVARLAS